MNTFRLLRLKTLPHPIEHSLRRRICWLVRRRDHSAQTDRNANARDADEKSHLSDCSNKHRSR